eukprot:TRINITY_DN3628_c3_g1_i1.p2 TRINITY_DN3628_c3_g1~~TRINITY_DN3628_c3_g1_i1.p2  ORF type:complete len:188 (-),score=-21.69 TRINITY_DN3628_c3_g1_i1:612-1175(-)
MNQENQITNAQSFSIYYINFQSLINSQYHQQALLIFHICLMSIFNSYGQGCARSVYENLHSTYIHVPIQYRRYYIHVYTPNPSVYEREPVQKVKKNQFLKPFFLFSKEYSTTATKKCSFCTYQSEKVTQRYQCVTSYQFLKSPMQVFTIITFSFELPLLYLVFCQQAIKRGRNFANFTTCVKYVIKF